MWSAMCSHFEMAESQKPCGLEQCVQCADISDASQDATIVNMSRKDSASVDD